MEPHSTENTMPPTSLVVQWEGINTCLTHLLHEYHLGRETRLQALSQSPQPLGALWAPHRLVSALAHDSPIMAAVCFTIPLPSACQPRTVLVPGTHQGRLPGVGSLCK